MSPDERKKIEELLPFYVNGSLSEMERELVTAACKQDTDLEAELQFLEKLRQGVKQRGQDTEASELTLQRLLNNLPTQSENKTKTVSKPVAVNDNWWKALAAAACVAFAIQTGYMVFHNTDQELHQAGIPATENHVVLQVMFQPTASEAEIRAFLLKHNLRIVDGPSSLDIYRLQPTENKKDLAAWLKEVQQNKTVLRHIGIQ